MKLSHPLPPTENGTVPPAWPEMLAQLEYAFQPIVNIHTGVRLGTEAILGNLERLGFPGVDGLMARAWQEDCLGFLDNAVRSEILHQLIQSDWRGETKLFYNLEQRLLEEDADYTDGLLRCLEEHRISADAVCLEVAERRPATDRLVERLVGLHQRGFKLALGDCGNDFSGLRLLWSLEPDYIKINRFFIRDLATHMRKRALLSSIINISHGMGCQVIAEGVENEKEYYLCKDLGGDMIQGPLVQAAATDLDQLRERYPFVLALSENDRRRQKGDDLNLVQTWMEYIPAVDRGADVFEIFQKFKEKKCRPFFVVVNPGAEPQGILHENNLREYAYSRFGNQLLQNPAIRENLGAFISRCPIADIHTPVERILELYSQNDTIEGVLIVENQRYVGFLNAQSLLKVIYEKNLALARDQNPLTKLAGNNLITEYVSRALQEKDQQYLLVYFDFDHFKPYNDHYGFRNGDRVILLFAELLQAFRNQTSAFIGHIGGDDFFAGLKNAALAEHGELVKQLAVKFRNDVESFYDPEAVQQGFLFAQDREGDFREFPLLTVSAVVLELKPGRHPLDVRDISRILADQKKMAKIGGHVRLVSLEETLPPAGETPGFSRPAPLSE